MDGVKSGSREMSLEREASYARAHTEDRISCGRAANDMMVDRCVVIRRSKRQEWFSIECGGLMGSGF